jgi:outer membrane murein-binding lipoprotein Lpp
MDGASYDMLLGEMRGQLRELVHSVNNLNGKVDGLTREVVALGPLAAAITDLNARVEKLEQKGNEQSGAYKILVAIVGSPFVMWLVMVAGFVWAAVTGRIQL